MREIRSRGYDGGVTQLKEYLNAIRPQLPVEPMSVSKPIRASNCRSTSSISGAAYFRFARSRRNSLTRDMRLSNSRTTSERKHWLHWLHVLNVRSNSSVASRSTFCAITQKQS
jgi:hypothetical protein